MRLASVGSVGGTEGTGAAVVGVAVVGGDFAGAPLAGWAMASPAVPRATARIARAWTFMFSLRGGGHNAGRPTAYTANAVQVVGSIGTEVAKWADSPGPRLPSSGSAIASW